MERYHLRDLRTDAGKSQEGMARDICMSTIMVRMIESGRRNPSTQTVAKYSQYFHETPEQLFPEIFLPEKDTKRIKRAEA